MKQQPTADIVCKAAQRLEEGAVRLRALAVEIQVSGDVTLAAEAVNEITNTFANLRLDLFITRPIRSLKT